MKWTRKQQEVIDARGSNLLVSAAAGSGKTAVLVERIINLICDRENPVDIDRLLVMTFTNAAASEMRERISAAIDRKLMEEPEQEHLQVQAALVHRAQITTIDSFCLSLIRDHFNLLDIDPAFRIGDEGELMLLRADVMDEMLEEYYEKDDPVFSRFVETYASGKSDSGIDDYIMQVYTFSQSNPFPEEWLDECRQELLSMEEGKLNETGWMEFLLDDVRKQADELADQLDMAMDVCRMEGGPEVYLPTLQTELEMVYGLKTAKDYDSLYERLSKASFGRMAAARGKNIDPEKKEYVSACRDRVKKAVKSLKELYGGQTPEEAVENILGSRDVVLKLLELAEEFYRRYQESKRDKNIVDFNDLEHEALRILINKEGGEIHYTAVADELSQRYVEILVDEYQDSNDVQETLIQSLSAERFGRPNVFMVGDVKQSIYKFRLARPELFMKKYEQYGEYLESRDSDEEGEEECQATDGKEAAKYGGEGCGDEGAEAGNCEEFRERQNTEYAAGQTVWGKDRKGNGKKIELRQNFRSRPSVLDSINEIFFQIMTKNLGNIEYTDGVALHAGAVFETTQEKAGTPTELLLVDTGSKVMGANDEELEEYTSREMEARLIASKIRELTDEERGLSVWDKEKGCYRRVRYGDMVILLRSLTGWTDSFLNVLTQEDIPAFAETGTGYFDTIEVETVLAMLAVIDNPIQDIPLATVLRSPVVGMNEEEMAWLMGAWKHNAKKGQDRGIYGALRLVLLGNETDAKQEVEEREEWEEWPDDSVKREGQEEWPDGSVKREEQEEWPDNSVKREEQEEWPGSSVKREEQEEWPGGSVKNQDKWEERPDGLTKSKDRWEKKLDDSVKIQDEWEKTSENTLKNQDKWEESETYTDKNGVKWGSDNKKEEKENGTNGLKTAGEDWKIGKINEKAWAPGKINKGNGEEGETIRWGDKMIDSQKSMEEWECLADKIGIPEETAQILHRKAAAFSRLFSELRSQAAYLPIHELIHRMYLQTGYYDYVSAMPAGEVRKANLDMLIEKASAYEKTSYKGLFHFIRYIERLKKYDTDFGEATAGGKTEQMVRIMSIHKSKGLEFPVVFLAGLGKNFNKQDIRGKLLIDGDLGIGADYFNVDTRVKISTMKKNVLKRKMNLDNLGEELRILYVAMTRAKEKLIMTATDRYLEKKLERWSRKTWDLRQIPYTILSSAGCYLDWLLMCQPEKSPLFQVWKVPVESLVGEAVARKISREVSREELRTLDLTCTYDEDVEKILRERLSYQYPHKADIDLYTKISVSELKKRGQDIDDRNSLFQPVIPEFLQRERAEMRDEEETVPATEVPEEENAWTEAPGEKVWREEDSEKAAGEEDSEKAAGEEDSEKAAENHQAEAGPGGAVRGSAYHRILELLDFTSIMKKEDVELWIKEACREGRITKDIAEMVRPGKIWRFLQTSMGRRMGQAQKKGHLHREQQFVMGVPARDMGLGDSDELVLIQGIIDAWMEEEDGLVLVDYKTDRIKKGQEEVLVKRYGVQLDYYRRALEQMVKRPVKERVIYSLTLQKEIRV